jgi:ParB-like chromosome segregation protein Spo0J
MSTEVHQIADSLLPLLTPIADISADPANVKKHPEAQILDLVASLRAFGQVQPLVVDKATKLILAGNGRFAAMKRLEWTHAAVVFVEWDATKGKTYQIADNRIPEGGTWDNDALKSLLPTLQQQDKQLQSMLDGLTKSISLDSLLAPAKGSRKVPQPIIKIELVFDSDAQQQSWFALLRKLKEKYSHLHTHGARLEQLARDNGFCP